MKKIINTNETTNNNFKSLKNKFLIPLLLLSLVLVFSFIMGTVSAVVTSPSPSSNIIYVNDSGGSDDNNGTSWEWAKKSIKNATETVNANGTVNIANGLYNGENNTNITINKNMNIIGQSTEGTIINGTDISWIFNIASGINVTIGNLTITNGNNDAGGAICNSGNLTISGCKFTDNTADYGGAIINDGNLTVSGSEFTGNTAQWYGGAICNGGNLDISGSTFTGNTAQDASGSVGGAIYNYGSSAISSSTFAGNSAANGGAIRNQDSCMTISGSTFTNNTSKKGGAIDNYYTNLNVTNCTFTGNTALSGGAIYNDGDDSKPVIISGSTFNSNIATGTGGDNGGAAIFSDGGTLNVTNSTFKDNDATASDSAAVYNYGGTLNVTGCTFTDNEGGAIVNENEGTLNVTGSNFTGNTVIYDGGAIWNGGTLNVTGSNFTSNGADGNGGAIYNNGTCTITGSNFTGNTADYGGTIYNYYGTCNMTGCTFTGNNAAFGAIYNYYGTCNVTSCTFTGNTALTCGAIYNWGICNVAGCTFTGNTANLYGGATFNGGTCNVAGCTFTGNTALNGGAVWNCGALTANFCRIVGNIANGDGEAIYNYNEQQVNAENNWWGSNNPDFDTLISGMPNPNYWLYMTLIANPTTINNGETSLITVSFNNLFNGTTIAPLDPATGHIPDGSPVNFQTDLGTIGCKSIDKTTNGGIATAILTATELAGIAHINATTDNQTLFVNVIITPKSGLYLTVTPSKANPTVGETVMYTLKVGNKGPDAAKDVIMTYVVPEGLEFVTAKVDVGEWKYDASTRTITWIIGDVPVGDPYMWLSLRIAQSGHYLINPVLSTSTYDPTLNADTQSITVNAATQVNAAGKTIPLQETGLPITGLLLAIMAVFGGLVTSKKF